MEKAMKRVMKIVAVLDIGSNFVRMGIYQVGKSGMERLDMLRHPLRLGHEVFTSGRISRETVRRLSSILRGYSQVMKEYGVTEYRVFATTALREAENRAYVLDQLKIQNNLVVEVLENGEESALVYASLIKMPQLHEQSLLAYVGTGSLGVAAWENGGIVQSCNITIGFLKLGEILHSLEDQTTRFYKVLEEYVETYFRRLTLRLGERRFHYLMLAGRNLDVIAPLCGAVLENGAYTMEKSKLEKLYDRVKGMHASIIAQQMALPEETAEQLLPMLALYLQMLEFTRTDRILAPPVNIMDKIAEQMLVEAKRREFETIQREGALACAREMARRHMSDVAHADRVRDNAVLLFDKLKKLHGVSGKRRILLECATLLHEIGYSMNARDASCSTFDAIKQSYLFGVGEEDMLLIAEIARYSDFTEAVYTRERLPVKQRLLVDKLSAIVMLADALDESRKGKIAELKVRLEPERLVVSASGREHPLLEKWAFMECAPFFETVFGIRAEFVFKSNLL